MAFPSTTNVDGSNPGPNVATQPDTTQSPIGNIQKIGTFSLTITPSACATGPSVNEQTFASTGIGLLTTDRVFVEYPGSQTAAVAIADSRVSAADTLAIKFIATAGTPTPAAGAYYVTVFRIQPNWTAPASGNQMDW
jgi:hypothetical protein